MTETKTAWKRLTLEEVSTPMKQHFPQVGDGSKLILIDTVGERHAVKAAGKG